MKLLALAFIAVYGLCAFADDVPSQIYCSGHSYQVFCPGGQCPPPPAPPDKHCFRSVAPQSDSEWSGWYLSRSTHDLGHPALMTVRGRYSYDQSGQIDQHIDLSIQDLQTGWTYSDFSPDWRNVVYMSVGHSDQRPGGFTISQTDFTCQMM